MLSSSNIQDRKEKIYDLTATITQDLVSFPGDPTFKEENVCSIAKGDHFHLSHISMGNHTGTHIDFPCHVIEGGKNSNDYPISNLMGSGLIIKIPDDAKSITSSFIKSQTIRPNDIVFFKTSNSRIFKRFPFDKNYVYIEPEAAMELLDKKVKIVGIDYISVDSYELEDLPVHRSLLANDILIVEGLELNDVPIGRCEIYIAPLKIDKMDGLPARVFAII
jgi:arylformamidase